MGWRTIETNADLDRALKAWVAWKVYGSNGYPTMDTLARAREARGGGVFGSRPPAYVDMPWDVTLCVRGMEWMRQTDTGRMNVAILHCHYLFCHVPEPERIHWMADWMREKGRLEDDAGLSRARYFERLSRAREQLMDWIQRRTGIAGIDDVQTENLQSST